MFIISIKHFDQIKLNVCLPVNLITVEKLRNFLIQSKYLNPYLLQDP